MRQSREFSSLRPNAKGRRKKQGMKFLPALQNGWERFYVGLFILW